MKVIVDTNIIFSGILKAESKIGQLLTNSKNYFDFYTVDYALVEIEKHKDKILSITKYSEPEYRKVIGLITKKIKYINESVIPENTLSKAIGLVEDFDLDDSYL